MPKKDMGNMENSIDNVIKFSKKLKEKSNVEITNTLDYLNNEFNFNKDIVINLTHKLDKIEELYNIILKEYNSRQNG